MLRYRTRIPRTHDPCSNMNSSRFLWLTSSESRHRFAVMVDRNRGQTLPRPWHPCGTRLSLPYYSVTPVRPPVATDNSRIFVNNAKHTQYLDPRMSPINKLIMFLLT